MTYTSKLKKAAEAFESLGIDQEEGHLFWSVSSYTDEVYIWHSLNEKNEPALMESVRKMTALFGPLKAVGTSKNIHLQGSLELGGITFSYRIHGAYTCEITGYKDKLAPAEEAKPERTIKEPIWGCAPNPAVVEQMRQLRLGNVGGGLPTPDPRSHADYEPEVGGDG